MNEVPLVRLFQKEREKKKRGKGRSVRLSVAKKSTFEAAND